MKTTSNIVYYLAIGIIILWFVLPILGLFIHFQIINEHLFIFHLKFRIFALPVAVLLTLFGTIKSTDNSKVTTKTIFLTILALVVSIIFALIGFFGSMCGWTTTKEIYRNKNNQHTKIALQEFSCGAYDGDIPKQKLHKVYQFSSYIILSHKTDTNSLDKSKWILIND